MGKRHLALSQVKRNLTQFKMILFLDKIARILKIFKKWIFLFVRDKLTRCVMLPNSIFNTTHDLCVKQITVIPCFLKKFNTVIFLNQLVKIKRVMFAINTAVNYLSSMTTAIIEEFNVNHIHNDLNLRQI
jgi:hypothetical protein